MTTAHCRHQCTTEQHPPSITAPPAPILSPTDPFQLLIALLLLIVSLLLVLLHDCNQIFYTVTSTRTFRRSLLCFHLTCWHTVAVGLGQFDFWKFTRAVTVSFSSSTNSCRSERHERETLVVIKIWWTCFFGRVGREWLLFCLVG